MTFITITLILFLIMDPLGKISSFLSVLQPIPLSEQKRIIFREMLIALGFMVAFFYIGDFILYVFEVSETAVNLTAGMILFLVAIKILFPGSKGERIHGHFGASPFIVPLAIPLIAGPALLATIMLFSGREGSIVLPAIILAWLIASILLYYSSFLSRTLGRNGLLALEQVMGMILVLLSIQRFMEGVKLLVS